LEQNSERKEVKGETKFAKVQKIVNNKKGKEKKMRQYNKKPNCSVFKELLLNISKTYTAIS